MSYYTALNRRLSIIVIHYVSFKLINKKHYPVKDSIKSRGYYMQKSQLCIATQLAFEELRLKIKAKS